LFKHIHDHEQRNEKNLRVILVIDSFNREFFAMELLARAFRSKGVKAILCARQVLGMTYNRFRPDIVLLPKLHKIPSLDKMFESSLIVLAQAESFTGSESAFTHFSSNIKSEFVDLVICWGEFDRNFYIENKIFTNERLISTGHPITESWYLAKKIPLKTRTIGIAMSIRALTHRALGPSPNPISTILQTELAGSNGYFIEPYHAEDWLAYESAWIRIVFQIISNNQEIHFSIRPHPLENPLHYHAFDHLSNVSIDHDGGHINEWLQKIDLLCSAFSTSMLDAYFMKVPVVSLRNLMPERILNCIHPSQLDIKHDNYFPMPKDIPELKNLLQNEWQAIPEVDDLGLRVFNFPQKNRPCKQIAYTLVQKALRSPKINKPFSPVRELFLERLCGPFSWAPNLRMLYLHLRDIVTSNTVTSSAYCKHRFKKNRRYLKLLETLQIND